MNNSADFKDHSRDASHPFDWNGELKPGPLEVGFDYAFVDIANRTGCCCGGSIAGLIRGAVLTHAAMEASGA